MGRCLWVAYCNQFGWVFLPLLTAGVRLFGILWPIYLGYWGLLGSLLLVPLNPPVLSCSPLIIKETFQ